jgi:hypothetical protein
VIRKPWKWPGHRRPGAHARAGARLHQVDGAAAAEVVLLAVARPVLLVRAPAELGRLAAFADEAVHRPGVDELVAPSGGTGDLRVALGDVDHLDAELVRERAHSSRVFGVAVLDAGVGGDVEQRLLDEVRDEAGVGAVREHRGRRARLGLAQRQRRLAQRVVGALRRRHRRIGVAARPRLDAGVEVERALLPAQLDQRDARHVHRQVEQEVAAAHQRIEHVLVKFSRVSGCLTKRTPYSAATFAPASSAVTIVICSGWMPTCRRISGNTPWPMLPKPTKIRRPGKATWTGY